MKCFSVLSTGCVIAVGLSPGNVAQCQSGQRGLFLIWEGGFSELIKREDWKSQIVLGIPSLGTRRTLESLANKLKGLRHFNL